jgi:metal-responsive CopG/Arc/MetJ family transcriptional regulator
VCIVDTTRLVILVVVPYGMILVILKMELLDDTMATIKTAISIAESIYREADKLAAQMKIARSRLFSLAVEEFIRRHRDRELLEQIDAVYSQRENREESGYLKAVKRKHGKIVAEQW